MTKLTINKELATSTPKMQPRALQGLISAILKLIRLDTLLYHQVGKELRQKQRDYIVNYWDQFTIKEIAKRFNCSGRNVDDMIRELKDENKL